MPCNHRFITELIPSWEVRYLFIGTFNPEWPNHRGGNAEYFYGRNSSQFWEILPKVFDGDNGSSLAGQGRIRWVEYCTQRRIGLTDLIITIRDADFDNPQHRQALTIGYDDRKLVEFDDLDFNTERIKQFISENTATIRGVFITRRPRIKRIWPEWEEIKNYCIQYATIRTGELYSPSPRARYRINEKIDQWRRTILEEVK